MVDRRGRFDGGGVRVDDRRAGGECEHDPVTSMSDATGAGCSLREAIASDDAGSSGGGGQGGAVTGSGTDPSDGGNGCAGGPGGGISVNGGSLSVTNTTLTADFGGAGGTGGEGGLAESADGQGGTGGGGGAGGSGGAIVVSNPVSATLLNVTIAENGTGSPGGGGAAGPAPDGGIPGGAGANGDGGVGGGVWAQPQSVCFGSCVPTKVQNSIVAEDEGGNCAGGSTGPILDEGHNITFGDTSCPGIVGDPGLGSLADNGGDTETLALGQGSAAIDAVPAAGAGCPATDQRGLTRPSGAACDAGAYEVTPPTATTGPASAIGTTSATVGATATANDGTATVQFEFGTSMAYGHETAVQSVGGLVATPVTAGLTGLTPGTTYHYRVVAASADGTTNGSDRTFTAAAVTPS